MDLLYQVLKELRISLIETCICTCFFLKQIFFCEHTYFNSFYITHYIPWSNLSTTLSRYSWSNRGFEFFSLFLMEDLARNEFVTGFNFLNFPEVRNWLDVENCRQDWTLSITCKVCCLELILHKIESISKFNMSLK